MLHTDVDVVCPRFCHLFASLIGEVGAYVAACVVDGVDLAQVTQLLCSLASA